MPIWAYIGGGALLAGMLGGWTLRDWKADADILAVQNKADKKRKEAEERRFDESVLYHKQLTALADQVGAGRDTIRTIYRDVKIPAKCAAPASVAGVLNDAVRAANAAAAGKPVGPVSTAGGATHTPDRPGESTVGGGPN